MGRIAFGPQGPSRGHGHQRHADGRDDHPGDDRREEANDLREERRQDETERGSDQHRPEDGAETFFPGCALQDRQHGGHAREGHTLYQRQLSAQERDADALQNGGQTADEQCRGHQDACSGGVQTGGGSDDQWHRNHAAVHGQDVLQAEGQGPPDAQVLVLGSLWCGGSG